MINIYDSTYLIIPEKIIKDNTLTASDKLIFGKIYSLTKQEKYCWASNQYLADYFNVTASHISKSINRLKNRNYLYIDLDMSQKNNTKRKIYIYYDSI